MEQAKAALLEELGQVLLDCLRLPRSCVKTQQNILGAVRHCALEAGWNEISAQSATALLPPWQEEIAVTMLSSSEWEPVTISHVAQACGMTATQFTRAFKAHFGVSPKRWRLWQRIEKAKKMMLETTLSLTDIACECGFAEHSHFTHAFVKLIGQSPRAWRQEVQAHRR